jgi:hypothetical protein
MKIYINMKTVKLQCHVCDNQWKKLKYFNEVVYQDDDTKVILSGFWHSVNKLKYFNEALLQDDDTKVIVSGLLH